MSDDIRKRVMSVDTPEANDSQQDERQPIDLADALMAIARTLDRLNTLLDRQESPLSAATRPQPKPSEEALPLSIEPRDVAPVDGVARGDVAKTMFDATDAKAAMGSWLASPAVPPAIKQDAVLPLANAPPRDVRQWLQPANGEAPPRFVAVAGGAWPQPQVLEARLAGGAMDIGNGVPVKEKANKQPLPDLPAVESFMAAMMPLAFNAKSNDGALGSLPLPATSSSQPVQPVSPSLPPLPAVEQAIGNTLPNIQPAALPATQMPSDSLEPSSRPISPTDAWMKQFLAQPPASLPTLPAFSTAAAMPSAPAGQTVTPNAMPAASMPAYAQPFPAWLPSPKAPPNGDVANAQPPSPSSWPTFPLTLPAMDGEQMANVRDMPPWMQHNMGTTDSNRDILSAMQGFSDAQRGFAETVLKSITHTTNELRVIQLRLENTNRYFHSDL